MMERQEVQKLEGQFISWEKDVGNPNWKKLLGRIAEDLGLLDEVIARSTIHFCPKCKEST